MHIITPNPSSATLKNEKMTCQNKIKDTHVHFHACIYTLTYTAWEKKIPLKFFIGLRLALIMVYINHGIVSTCNISTFIFILNFINFSSRSCISDRWVEPHTSTQTHMHRHTCSGTPMWPNTPVALGGNEAALSAERGALRALPLFAVIGERPRFYRRLPGFPPEAQCLLSMPRDSPWCPDRGALQDTCWWLRC